MSLLPIEFYDQLVDNSRKSNIRCDIYEENNNYVIKADIVDANKKDVELTVKEGHLTISVKRQMDNSRKYILRERKKIGVCDEKSICRNRSIQLRKNYRRCD